MKKPLRASLGFAAFFSLASFSPAATPIDLSKAANMGLAESFDEAPSGAGDLKEKNGLKNLPTGSQSFRGIPFRILEPSSHQGRSFVVLKGRRKPSFPEGVSIPVDHLKASFLYFLHTCRWGGTGQNITVAEYDVVYEDGQVVAIPLRVGMEFTNFFNPEDTSASYLAWWHQYKNVEMGINFFPWKNPRPDKAVQSILFKSRGSMPVPILFAITASDKELPISPDSPKPEKTFQTDTSKWIPLESSSDSPVSTAIDMGFLLDAPAGKHGKVKADGDKLIFEDGTPARFWGFTLPDEWWKLGLEETGKMAEELARAGYNLVLAQDPSDFPEATMGNIVPWISLVDHMKEKGIYVLWKQDAQTHSQRNIPVLTGDDPAVIPLDLWTRKPLPVDPAGSRAVSPLLPAFPNVMRPENNPLFFWAGERALGKPFLAQWGDEGWNPHLAEIPLLFSAYAGFQGWTGSYGWKNGGDDRMGLLLRAQWPVAALTYLRGDLKEGKFFVIGKGSIPLKALAHKSGVSPEGNGLRTDRSGELKAKINEETKSLVSDTGQITWQGNVGVVKVEAPRFQALIGFLSHRKFNNPYWAVETPNVFASLSAVSLNTKALNVSDHLLLTGVTRVENTGMIYNAAKTKLLSAGKAPLLVEPLAARIVLYRFKADPKLRVRALDAQGQPLKSRVSAKWVKNSFVFSWVPSAFYLEIYK